MSALEVDHQTSTIGLSAAKAAAGKTPFYRKLYVQVLVAVALGALLGYAYPDLSIYLKPFGDAFVRAIKVVVTPIIFTTIVVGIAKMGDIRRVANVGFKALIYFKVASTLALVIGMTVGNVWKVGVGLNADPAAFDPKAVEGYAKLAKNITLSDFLQSIIPSSFVEPFVKGEIMPVLFIAVLLGLALSAAQARGRPLVSFLEAASVALFGMVRIIMYFAPLAALCAMAFTVGKYGLRTLLNLGELSRVGLSRQLPVRHHRARRLPAAFRLQCFSGAELLQGRHPVRVRGDVGRNHDAALDAEAGEGRRVPRGRGTGDARRILLQHGWHGDLHDHGGAVPCQRLQCPPLDLAPIERAVRDAVHLQGGRGVTGGGFIALAATLPVVDACLSPASRCWSASIASWRKSTPRPI